jgi:glutamine synthetase
MWGTVTAASALPVLDDAELKLIDEEFAAGGVRLVLGSVVDMAGVARAKSVPAARSAAFHRSGMGASPTWNVLCIDNGIAFTPPLIITDAEVDRAVQILGEAITDAASGVVSDDEVAPYAGW